MNAAKFVEYYLANLLSDTADVRADGDFSALVVWVQDGALRKVHFVIPEEFMDDFNEASEAEQDRIGEAAKAAAGFILNDPKIVEVTLTRAGEDISFF